MSVAPSADRVPRSTRPLLLVLAQGPTWISLRYLACRDSRALADGIERALRQLPGVDAVRADSLTARIKVRFDRSRVDKDRIRVAILAAPPVVSFDGGRYSADVATAGPGSRSTRLVIGGASLAGLLAARVVLGAAALSGGPLLAIAAAATLVCGYPTLRNGVRSLMGRCPLGTDAMVTLATAASLVLGQSLTALGVVCLLDLGEWLRERVQARTRQAMEALLGDVPTHTWVVRHGAEILVPLDEVRVGEVVAVQAGDRLPVDGTIVDGTGLVDDSWLTGTTGPTERGVGDEALAGTRLLRGSLWVRAERVGTDSAIGQLRLLVATARPDGAPIGRAGQRFARRLVPVAIGLAVLTLLLTRDPARAIAMLLIACPCATGLSAHTAMTAALHVGARRGILFRGPKAIEAATRIDTLIIDVHAARVGAGSSPLPETVDAVRALRRAGLHVVVLGARGGDVPLGIPGVAVSCHADSLVALRTIVAEARAAGRRVALVSDRLDAVLSFAGTDLRIAIGGGAGGSALDAVDVLVASQDLRELVILFDLSRRALGAIRLNYGLSLLAEVGGLVAGFVGVTHPLAAAMVHSLSTLGVLASSARLIRYQPPTPLALPEPSTEPADR